MGIQPTRQDGELVAYSEAQAKYTAAAAPINIPVATSAPADADVVSGAVVFYVSGSDLLVKYNNGSSVIGATVASSMS
ncbi:MAG: hypothetical protein ACPHCN_12700 [Mycobacterium sp.]